MPPSRSIFVKCECGHHLSAFQILSRVGKIKIGVPPSIQALKPLVPKLRCSNCGCRGKVTFQIVERNKPRPRQLPRTDGKARVRSAPSIALSSTAPTREGHCAACGSTIPLERLRTIPGTRYCVSCASRHSSAKKRMVSEPWGSREDWKRDRASWKRNH